MKFMTGKLFAGIFLVPLTLLTVLFQLSTCGMVLYRVQSKYRFSTVVAGGCYDQDGLARLVYNISALLIFTVLGYGLSVLISRLRWWRILCIASFFAALVVPVGATLLYSWELARYIAVMGVTADRICGVRCAVIFLFIEMICLTAYLAGVESIKRIIFAVILCLTGAFAIHMSVDVAARDSVSSHPRPSLCFPNNVWVPDVPETSPDYGFRELIFGISAKER